MLEIAKTSSRPYEGEYTLEDESAPCWRGFEERMQDRLHLVKNHNLTRNDYRTSTTLPENNLDRV